MSLLEPVIDSPSNLMEAVPPPIAGLELFKEKSPLVRFTNGSARDITLPEDRAILN